MVSKKSSETISQEIESTPDLSYLEEKITLTNLHPFRRLGLSCRNCGSKNEMLWIEGKAVYLICADCKKDKGKEPFVEGKLLLEK